jgi:glycosyltransferase involved in cell wall biosynthesis
VAMTAVTRTEDILNARPLVSIAVITYNHERYIRPAIESTLNQTYNNVEVVVVDDGSTDQTPDILASMQDPRLIVIRQANRGPSSAVNRSVARCTGRYVALFSGDDICALNRVQRQLEEYVKGPTRVLFSDVKFIDDGGNLLSGGHFAASHFRPFSANQAEIIERFFFSGNFLSAITCFTETDILRTGRAFDAVMYQLQDYMMWINLVKRYPFQYMPEPLAHYRIRSDGQNLSCPSQTAVRQNMLESYLVMQQFFTDMPDELFIQAFGRHLQRPPLQSSVEVRCEQAFLLLRLNRPFIPLLGLQRLRDLLNDPVGAETLERKYNFTAVTFATMLKSAQM